MTDQTEQSAADETTADVAGYLTPIWLPVIVVKIVEQLRQQENSISLPPPIK